jgi:hypothetical protein
MHDRRVTPGRPLAVALAAAALLVAPATAVADDGGSSDDVRVAAACSGTSRSKLRVREHDGALRIELEVSTRRRGATWSVVVVHERRLAARVRVRTSGSGSFSVRRTVADWFGDDTVVVRATGPAGETCRATATLPSPR